MPLTRRQFVTSVSTAAVITHEPARLFATADKPTDKKFKKAVKIGMI